MGSSVSFCDIENRPLVNRFEASSYQKDEGTKTLFNISNCFSPISNINFNGIQLESQTGIDILVAESLLVWVQQLLEMMGILII